MAKLREVPGPRRPVGKALRERFRYARASLDSVDAQLVNDSIDKLGKSTVLSLFYRNRDMMTTLTALTKLRQACSV
jgi:hypothetical protein